MSVGVVVYIEFPAGTNRADAAERAHLLQREMATVAHEATFEMHGVIAKPLDDDPTTMLSLKRRHLTELHRIVNDTPPSSYESAPREAFFDNNSRSIIIGRRSVKFSPQQWHLLTVMRAELEMTWSDAFKAVMPGNRATPVSQISRLQTVRTVINQRIRAGFVGMHFEPIVTVPGAGLAWSAAGWEVRDA